jgi:thiol-disulfide isomerase/thioredoxin
MKKIFPIISIFSFFVIALILQMTLSGNMTSASKSNMTENKMKAYEKIYKELTLKTTKGSEFILDKLDQDIVILNFWASWCRPCVSEFKALNSLISQFSESELIVIGINNDDEEPLKAIKKIENEYELKFESVEDANSDLAGKFRINSIPASVVYHKGKVIHFVNKEFDFTDSNFVDLLKSKIKK